MIDTNDMREAFEKSMNDEFPGITLGGRHGNAYWTPMIDNMWQGFQMAMRLQSLDQPALIVEGRSEHNGYVIARKVGGHDAKMGDKYCPMHQPENIGGAK